MNANGFTVNGRAAKRIELDGTLLWKKENKLPDGLVLWYDIERQGYSNSDFIQHPYLIDLSGNGLDMQLLRFTFDGVRDGLTKNKGLYMSSNAHGYLGNFPILTDLTIIAKRIFMTSFGDWCAFLSTSVRPGAGWIFEINDKNVYTGNSFENTSYSYKYVFTPVDFPPLVSWMTLDKYNGQISTNTNPNGMQPQHELWLGCLRANATCPISNTFYKLMIFDHSLEDSEIDKIIEKYFE